MFELVLLILIFSIWLIGARIVQVYAVLTTRCAEDLAAFGSSTALPPSFVLLFWASVFVGFFWLCVTFSHWSILRNSKTTLFHTGLLLCILLLAANFRAMHIDNNQPADGTLVTGNLIVDKSLGDDQYFKLPQYDEDYAVWVMGRPSTGSVDYRLYNENCVWLDQNLILVNDSVEVTRYGTATHQQRREMLREKRYHTYRG